MNSRKIASAVSAWPDIQGLFADALRDPSAPPPGAVGKTDGAPSSRRFNVYRNNVALSLIDALAANFPVCARLVGGDAFRDLARAYIAEHLPHSPLMADYGDDLPAFIEGYAPLRRLAFLSDAARLERAWSRAYNAAEAAPVGIDVLSAVDPEALGEARFAFHPSVGLVRAAHPVGSIWFAHQVADTEAALKALPHGGEDVLVTRPEADVELRCLPAGAGEFVDRLLAGESLNDAAEAASDATDTFDLGAGIGGLFEARSVMGLHLPG